MSRFTFSHLNAMLHSIPMLSSFPINNITWLTYLKLYFENKKTTGLTDTEVYLHISGSWKCFGRSKCVPKQIIRQNIKKKGRFTVTIHYLSIVVTVIKEHSKFTNAGTLTTLLFARYGFMGEVFLSFSVLYCVMCDVVCYMYTIM